MRRLLPLLTVALIAVLVLAPACRSTKPMEAPATVEAKVQAAPAAPDRVEYIDVNPWTLKPGERADVTVGGTADRTASVTLTGVEGKAQGTTRTVNLQSAEGGKYTGSIVADPSLPPGKYRVEAQLSGGPSGEPTKLVSSRAVTIAEAEVKREDPCAEAVAGLAQPRIHFAYDKSDLNADSRAYIAQVARQLAGFRDRVERLVIEGHCDERGTAEYNLNLGARRAKSVLDALNSEAGISGMPLETLSKGEESPLIPNATTEEEHAQNRRAVFILECAPQR